MALTILTAGLAACGLLLLLWSVAEAMLLPLPREDAVLVAPLQGGAAEVERQIRGCRWMREHRGLRAQIIWIDRGLTPEGQEAAARLLRDAAGEQLCAAGQLHQLNSGLHIALLPILFAVAALLFSRWLAEGYALREENEGFI